MIYGCNGSLSMSLQKENIQITSAFIVLFPLTADEELLNVCLRLEMVIKDQRLSKLTVYQV